MSATFDDVTVSVGLFCSDEWPDGDAAFGGVLAAIARQDHPCCEIIVGADGEVPATVAARIGAIDAVPVRVCKGPHANQAAVGNAILNAARGEFLLLVDLRRGAVTLKSSAVRTLAMAAARNEAGMVYADYAVEDGRGNSTDIHLLDWHPGRLRDDFEFGPALLFRTASLREIGGFDERFHHAQDYDLRLRVSERGAPVHIANRFAGALYSVAAPAAEHDVFAYLRASRDAQIEAERACTAHLRRTGAWLAPGAHVQVRPEAADDDARDAARYADCIASVVIPVNQRPEFIGRAIESVQAQTETRVEVIVVVNGGENDPTANAVRQYTPGGDRYQAEAPPVSLIVVDVNNLGLCLNTGIAAARGRFYVQLDSDDRLKPNALARLLAVFDSDPTIAMVIGSYEVWTLHAATGELTRNADIPVVKHEEWTADNGRNNLLRINGAGAPRAALIAAIREVGWFGLNDTPHCRNYGEDYDLVLRISERYAIGRVWEPIYEVIRHAGGTDHAIDQATIDRNNEAKDHMRLAAFNRRRTLNGHSDATPAGQHGV